MPTTVVSLVIFIAFLFPGFVFFLQRGRSPVKPKLSPLAETVSFLAVSVLTNLVAVVVFAALRLVLSRHTPDIRKLILEGSSYIAPRTGYLLGWGLIALAISVGLAFLLGWRSTTDGAVNRVVSRIFPILADVSAWYHVFEDEVPHGTQVYVGCDMRNGVYVCGYLAWYNTSLDDIPDRDLVLSKPQIRAIEGAVLGPSGFQTMVVAARDIVRLHVSYLNAAESAQP